MWQFILGLIVGSNFSLIFFAIILTGKRSESENIYDLNTYTKKGEFNNE